MKVLFLQFVNPHHNPARAVFSQHLGTLSAMLKARGFETALAAMAGYNEQALAAAMEAHAPAAVLVELHYGSVSAAHRTIADIAQKHRSAVIVAGPYATCRPTSAISIPGAKALLLGEYEAAAVELLCAWRDGHSGAGTAGTWLHTPSGLVKGELRELLADLDALPPADRELWPPADTLAVQVARGCPRWCGHCVNDWYMDVYSQGTAFVRRRSVAGVLEEIAACVAGGSGRAGANGAAAMPKSVTIRDHAFALDEPWLEEFCRAYPGRCSVPFECFVPVENVTPQLAATLRAGMCSGVRTQIGSGSRFIREEILSMNASNEQIVAACRTLREAGLGVTARVLVGCPYESEITLEETLSLLHRCGADRVVANTFAPLPGSRAAELCAENGWISGRGEEHYWAGRSVLDLPSVKANQIDAVVRNFDQLLRQAPVKGFRKALEKVCRPPGGLLARLRNFTAW